MPRHNYISPFHCWDQDTDTSEFASSSLSAASSFARGQHPNALIRAMADCMIWNVRQSAEVSISAWQTESKTYAEIYELLDAKVDQVLIDRQSG